MTSTASGHVRPERRVDAASWAATPGPGDHDRWIGVDWSGAVQTSNQHIFVAEVRPKAGGRREVTTLTRASSRTSVEHWLAGGPLEAYRRWAERWPVPDRLLPTERTLVGLDFAFGFPRRFWDSTRGLNRTWQWSRLLRWAAKFSTEMSDSKLQALGFRVPGRRWDPKLLPEHQLRETDYAAKREGVPVSDVFNLVGGKQVGKGSIHGMAMLHRLRQGGSAVVWPFEAPPQKSDVGPVLVEVFPGRWSGQDKAHVPIRLKRIEEWEAEGLTWKRADLRFAAIGSADAFDAVGAAFGISRVSAWPEPLPGPAKNEGWILGVRPTN